MSNHANIKQEFVTKLNRFLQHKNVLANNSKYYRVVAVASSLARCNSMFTYAIQNCGQYSLDKICQLVVLNQNHLRNILPNPNNPSYKSSCVNVETLIAFAESYGK